MCRYVCTIKQQIFKIFSTFLSLKPSLVWSDADFKLVLGINAKIFLRPLPSEVTKKLLISKYFLSISNEGLA